MNGSVMFPEIEFLAKYLDLTEIARILFYTLHWTMKFWTKRVFIDLFISIVFMIINELRNDECLQIFITVF